MKRAAFTTAFVASLLVAGLAHADDAVRVVIAGPKKDPLAARLEKELVALGFAPVAVGALDCNSANVVTAVQNAGASAALCASNGRVAVWTDDGHEVKLRDTVTAKDAKAADTIAMQAAEVMRANIAFREPEPEPVEAPPPRKAPPSSGLWDEFDTDDKPLAKPKPEAIYAPQFTMGAGASYLMGQAASVGGLSLSATFRAHRHLSFAAHVDAPLSGTRAEPLSTASPPDGSKVRMTPGIVGAGLEVPFVDTDAFVVPRLGGAVGFAWIHATKTPGVLRDSFGSFVTATNQASDTTFAPAGWISTAFSFRVAGPMRVVAEGLLGATGGGIAIRNQGILISRWGLPFASAGLRAELMLP